MKLLRHPFFYELRPGIVLFIGVAAIHYEPHSSLMALSGLMLMLCAAMITHLRLEYRGYLRPRR